MSSEQSTSPVAHKSLNERTTCFTEYKFCGRLYTALSKKYNSCINMSTLQQQIDNSCNMCSVDLQISDSAPEEHSSILMQSGGYSQGPGMILLLCRVNQKGTQE